jgi:hypothetical protein
MLDWKLFRRSLPLTRKTQSRVLHAAAQAHVSVVALNTSNENAIEPESKDRKQHKPNSHGEWNTGLPGSGECAWLPSQAPSASFDVVLEIASLDAITIVHFCVRHPSHPRMVTLVQEVSRPVGLKLPPPYSAALHSV